RRFGNFMSWNFNRGRERIELTLSGLIAVDDTEAYLEAGLAGLGVFAMPHFMVDDALADGRLTRVLADWHTDPVSVYVMYPQHRLLTDMVRVFTEWVSDLMHRYMQRAPGWAPRRPRWRALATRGPRLRCGHIATTLNPPSHRGGCHGFACPRTHGEY